MYFTYITPAARRGHARKQSTSDAVTVKDLPATSAPDTSPGSREEAMASARSNQSGKSNLVRVKFGSDPIKHRLAAGATIAPAPEPVKGDTDPEAKAESHAAEPIKDLATINKICEHLLTNGRYRDFLLFVLGINFGLRVSDLLRLRWCDLIDEDMTFKHSFEILEKKTSRSRKRKRNRYVVLNDAVMNAANIYLQHTDDVTLADFLFRSHSNQCKHTCKPLHRSSVDVILKTVAKELDLKEKVSTHTLRKTFGYHQMVMSGNNPRKLLLLQKIFGHSSVEQTLDYIGVTREEIEDAYTALNLGLGSAYETCEVVELTPPAADPATAHIS